MPTPCTHCKHPLSTTGVCTECEANQEKAEITSEARETEESESVSTTTDSDTIEATSPTRRLKSSTAAQKHPQRINDPQIQITQQLQARSKLTALQPKPIRLALPRVLVRNPPRPRMGQSPVAGNSSASQVTQQVQHQIRQRYRIVSPRQEISSPQGITKYRLIPESEIEHRTNGCQEAGGILKAQSEVLVGGGSSAINTPIRIITSTSNTHNSPPIATVIGTAINSSKSRVTQLVRAVTPGTGASHQLVKLIQPAETAVVSATTPSAPLQFKVATSNSQTPPPLYKILYSIPSQPAVAGLSSSQLTPLTLSNSQVVSSVLVTPSGALQVFRHAPNPCAQAQQNSGSFKQLTHQSLSLMGPSRQRLLRSKALPSIASRLSIEPPPVVTIDDEDMGSNTSKDEEDHNNSSHEMVPFDYYKLTILKEPDGNDKGEFRVRAQQLRIGSFLLRDRLVTFSRNILRILARPVDSLTEEAELTFTYKDILKIVWATCAQTPAIIFNFSPDCGERTREALHIQYHDVVLDKRCDDAKHPYFEPRAVLERQRQVVIILGEPFSDEEYSFIQDCYPLSPKGSVKREFAEKLLEITEPNTRTPETPLLPLGGTSSPTLVQQQPPGASIRLGAAIRKRKSECNIPAKIVTSNGIVTVTSHSSATNTPTTIQLPPGVTFTNQTPICRYPPSGTGGIVIRAQDLLTLLPDSSVNDAVIDFYLSYITGEVLPKEKAEKIFVFNTFFYSSLVKPPQKPVNTGIPEARRQHANVKRWTKGVDLFTKDFILIPVCENSHWFLIIVAYPWLVPKRHGLDLDTLNVKPEDPTAAETPTKDSPDSSTGDSEPVVILEAQKTPPRDSPTQRKSDIKGGIFVFDSLRGHATSAKIFRLIRDYLAEEFLARKGVKCSFDYYSMRGYHPIVPQQTNSHDCGIFLLEYARNFLMDPPEPQALGSTQMFNKMFDPDLVMQKGRWEVAEVMFQLSEKQFPELKGVPRMKYENRIKVEGSTLGEEVSTPQFKRTRASNTPK